jgi:hypothetical protein
MAFELQLRSAFFPSRLKQRQFHPKPPAFERTVLPQPYHGKPVAVHIACQALRPDDEPYLLMLEAEHDRSEV